MKTIIYIIDISGYYLTGNHIYGLSCNFSCSSGFVTKEYSKLASCNEGWPSWGLEGVIERS